MASAALFQPPVSALGARAPSTARRAPARPARPVGLSHPPCAIPFGRPRLPLAAWRQPLAPRARRYEGVGRRDCQVRASEEPSPGTESSAAEREAVVVPPPPTPKKVKRKAESTDAVATFLTRRFGLAGGLAWLGILTFGVVSEQVKTRLEVASEIRNTVDAADAVEVVTASGLRYTDVRVGGGATPYKGDLVAVNLKLSVPPPLSLSAASQGDLVAVNLKLSVGGDVIEDTFARKKPIVYLFGTRPFNAGNCPGVEEALSTMKVGGIRKLVVPPELAFGDVGFELGATQHVPDKEGRIPGGATLEYMVELVRSSIPPS